MSPPPSPSTQEQKRKLGADIKARTQNLLPPRQPPLEAGSSSAALPVQLPENSASIPVDNAYALELFKKHTNVREIVEKRMPQLSDNAKQRYVEKYYNQFIQKPHMRIREPLHEIRFTSQAHEGVFRMVQKLHLTSAVQLQEHKEMLKRNNVQQMFFVDMTIDNCCLDYQHEIIQKLKSGFTNWSPKLDKLPKYLLSAHEVRQAADRYFLRLVKRSSSVKHSQLLKMPHVVEEFVRESRIPSERRVNILWSQLEFDDDALNRKYECGEYSKFRFKCSLLKPVESLECALREYYRARGLNPKERCIKPGKQGEICPPNQENIEQPPVAEDGTEMEITTNDYERVNAEQKLAMSSIARIDGRNEIVLPENVVQQREEASPVQEIIEPTPPPAHTSLQRAPSSTTPSPPVVPSQKPPLPPRPTTAVNKPKRKQQEKDPILGIVVTKWPRRIQYDSEESFLTPDDDTVQKEADVIAEPNNNQSIEFVSIPMGQLSPILASVANPPVSQASPLPDSLDLDPFASSTEDQAPFPEIQNTQANVAAATQTDGPTAALANEVRQRQTHKLSFEDFMSRYADSSDASTDDENLQ